MSKELEILLSNVAACGQRIDKLVVRYAFILLGQGLHRWVSG